MIHGMTPINHPTDGSLYSRICRFIPTFPTYRTSKKKTILFPQTPPPPTPSARPPPTPKLHLPKLQRWQHRPRPVPQVGLPPGAAGAAGGVVQRQAQGPAAEASRSGELGRAAGAPGGSGVGLKKFGPSNCAERARAFAPSALVWRLSLQ